MHFSGRLMHRAKRTNVGRIAIRPPPKQDDGPRVATTYNAALEIRTVAGPSRVVQWVLSGGPYTV